MIREFGDSDLDIIMQIWVDTNIQAHNFIPKEYWINNNDMVREMLPQAEVYVYEDDETNQIVGFIGLADDYIAGIFVRNGVQSKGIGIREQFVFTRERNSWFNRSQLMRTLMKKS